MKQHLEARLVPTPAWARRPETRFYGDTAEAAQAAFAFGPHLPEILSGLHEQIEAFFNDPGCTFEEGFPEKSRLTGEYYWGDRTYAALLEDVDERPHYRLWQEVRCLEKKWIEHQTDFDYLGLEACVFLWRDTGRWELLPEFDVRVI